MIHLVILDMFQDIMYELMIHSLDIITNQFEKIMILSELIH